MITIFILFVDSNDRNRYIYSVLDLFNGNSVGDDIVLSDLKYLFFIICSLVCLRISLWEKVNECPSK